MGVEPISDGETRRPPVLKTGAITGLHALPSVLAYNVFLKVGIRCAKAESVEA